MKGQNDLIMNHSEKKRKKHKNKINPKYNTKKDCEYFN